MYREREVLNDNSVGVGEAPSTMGRAGVTVRPPMAVERSSIMFTGLMCV